MKNQLVFDVSDAQSVADSDQVGAVVQGLRSGSKRIINSKEIDSQEWLNVASALHAGDGTAITQTGGALDVNIASPLVIEVDMDGDYDGVGNPTPDSVGLIAHDRSASPGMAQQNQRPTAGLLGSIAAANLGNVHALDVNAFAMGINDTSGDAESLSIIDSSGGLSVHISGSDATVDVSDAALANTAIAHAATTLAVANTPQNAVASPLANRKYLFLQNNSNKRIFVGATGVSAATGFPLAPSSVLALRAGAAVDIEFVGQSGDTPQIRTLELS